MFRNLLPRLFGEDPASASRLSAEDAEMAVAALMVRIARADHNYSDAERRRIDSLLARRQRPGAAEPADRRAAAEMLEAEAPDTVRFTRAVKERIPLEDRTAIVAALWEVALADGERAASEDAAVRLTASLLGVNDVDSALSRQRVEQALSRED